MFFLGKSSHKRGHIYVTVGDRETFIEIEIVEHAIVQLGGTFDLALSRQLG